MISWYVAVKLGEWVIWSGIAIYFLVRAFRYKEQPLWLYLALAVAFFVFGMADFIEYFNQWNFSVVAMGLEDWRRAYPLWPPRGPRLCEERAPCSRALAFCCGRSYFGYGDFLHSEIVGKGGGRRMGQAGG
jgi:hypothetical protein